MRDHSENRESPDDLIRLPEVVRSTGLSKSEIYRRIADKRFPKQVKLGPRVSAWRRGQVARWKRQFEIMEDLTG